MRVVVALGGNALLRRGQPMSVANQRENVRTACDRLAPIAAQHELVVSHGNGPQIGLLALEEAAYEETPDAPLDVLGAETQGMIGYLIEQELGNRLPFEKPLATLLTMIEVDPDDPAFGDPTKPIGPIYTSEEAEKLARRTGLGVQTRRRQHAAGRAVADTAADLRTPADPVAARPGLRRDLRGWRRHPDLLRGRPQLRGVEAVIDKDHASGLLARDIGADVLIMATDAPGRLRVVRQARPARDHAGASRRARANSHGEFAAGSMLPKVIAACDFAARDRQARGDRRAHRHRGDARRHGRARASRPSTTASSTPTRDKEETMAFGVHSEVGKLRKVMVHRPGLEHSRLTPSNAEELLFDDVLWVTAPSSEHDAFCEVMRERGVEVFHAETAARRGARRSPTSRTGSAHTSSTSARSASRAADRAREWVETADPAQVADFLIGGITKADVEQDVGLVWESADPTSMLLPPLPNFLFQRDPSCWIYDGVTFNPMTKPARMPESMIVEAIYRFHPMFAAEQFPIWLGGADEDWGRAHVEGGDVQPIGNGAVMIGMGERTTPQAVLWIARELFRAGSAHARPRGAPPEVPQLHAPRHGHHDVRPRSRHAVPAGRLRRARVGDPTRRHARRPRRRGAAGHAARAHGAGARRLRDARRRDRRRLVRGRA